MPNLTLVGYGDICKVKSFVSSIQKTLNNFCVEHSVNVYNLDTLGRAECNPDLLIKKGRVSLSTIKSSYDKDYWGVIKCSNYDELYSNFFGSISHSGHCPQSLSYNKTNFLKVIKTRFNSTSDEADLDDDFPPCDFTVKYRYECMEQRDSYAIIEWCFKRNSEYVEDSILIKYFNAIISELDNTCSDTFKSAYITNLPSDINIMHHYVYGRYDKHDLSSYLLGAEYSVYMCKNIAQKCFDMAITPTDDFSLIELNNGLQCNANVKFDEFDSNSRKILTDVFRDFLMPAYGLYDWSDISQYGKCVNYLPKEMYIYTDDPGINMFDMIDPCIVFSYNMDIDKIMDDSRNLYHFTLIDHYLLRS